MSSRTIAATETFTLTPGQQRTYELAEKVARVAPVVVLEGGIGLGKTLVLQRLQKTLGGRILSLRDALQAIEEHGTIPIEEAVHSLLLGALRENDIVYFDDFDVLSRPTRMTQAYSRPMLLDAVLKEAYAEVHNTGKTLIFAQFPPPPGSEFFPTSYESVTAHGVRIEIPLFRHEDYAAIFGHNLGGENAAKLDVDKIYRFASKLTGYQLENICRILGSGVVTTADVLSCIEERILISNLAAENVEAIAFSDLKGAEKLIEELETHVLLPMQKIQQAQKLGLKPKRGVLLHGSPGTGKTSVGRALARQMKGKFFMIDGNFVTEPPAAFFIKVRAVFEAAKANSPSVIFIDDADVLFQTDHVYGLNRYLLTMLDGLESETVGDVCVMLTAMNVKDLPPALLRSGRVELWLETKLPGAATRKEILLLHAKHLINESSQINYPELMKLTDGFTPADLRRIVADGKAILLYDQEKGRPPRDFGAYIMIAAKQLRELKISVASALGNELPKSSDSFDAVNSCG